MPEYWRGRPVVVAGGNGFIGAAIVRTLLKKGATVTSAVRGPKRSKNLMGLEGLTTVYADFTSLQDCDNIVHGQNHVFIAAAVDGNAEFKRSRAAYIFRNNSTITMNLLEASRRNNVGGVTYLSSAEVYAGIDAQSVSETQSLGDVSNAAFGSYALAKIFGEVASRMFYREHGLPVAIARPCNVYGPGDYFDRERGRVIPQWIRAGLEEAPIRIWGDGTEVRSFIYIDDLVDGLLRLAERHANATPTNLAGPEESSLLGLAELIKRIGAFTSPIEHSEVAAAGPARRVLDTSLARESLDFEPLIGLEDGLSRTVTYFRHIKEAPKLASVN